MLAHVRNGELIRLFRPDPNDVYRGILSLENGGTASPPQEGYVNGNDKVLPVVEETSDSSTGPDKHRTDSGYQVETDRVYRLITVRDMTQQELDDRELERATNASTQDIARLFKKVMAGQFQLVKAANGGSLTLNQYKNWLNSNPTIPDADFIAFVREVIE